jgi:ATP-dependent Clp protease ATP-binding subunit ClpX
MFTNKEMKKLQEMADDKKQQIVQHNEAIAKVNAKLKELKELRQSCRDRHATETDLEKKAAIVAEFKALKEEIKKHKNIGLAHQSQGEACKSMLEFLIDEIRNLNNLTTFDNPEEIYNELNKNVVGQDEAKKALAVASFNNILRAYKDIVQPYDGTQLDKDIVLMVGKTGTGKTLLVNELARILKVPAVIADATKVTSYGFTGVWVNSWIQELDEQARDMDSGSTADELFYKGIIFIDEFDKLATRFENSESGNHKTTIQHDLLKLLEGTQCKFTRNGKEHTRDTRPIMFILGGAFGEIEEEMQGKNSIGFSSDFVQKGAKRIVTDEDIIKYGFSRELVGRITEIVQLDDMTEELLVKIATHGKNSPVNRYKKLFELREVEADIDDDLVKELAHKAIAMGTGARALNKAFKEFFRPYEFEAHKHAGKTLHFETAKPEAAQALKLSH